MLERQSRLRLGRRIGRGGMAEVFAGTLLGPAGFEKDVAVKRVLPRYADNPMFLARFLDEARLAARLSHPNIVQIFELGQDGPDHYIVMEAVRGPTLNTCLQTLAQRGEKMPSAIALHIAQCVCAGLAAAHELSGADGRPLGIVHRDVSPHNVLLGFDGAIKLIDFGIARAADIPSMTRSGLIVGKPHYMAPEQITGQPVDGRADVFALGVMLFEMLSGELPFQGDTRAVIDEVAEGRRPTLASLDPNIDADVAAAVEKALAHELPDRFPSARAFGAALLSASHGLTRTSTHDLEALLARLFPADIGKSWPSESARADNAAKTGTVEVPVDKRTKATVVDAGLREITLISSDAPADAPAPSSDPLHARDTKDVTLDDQPQRRRTPFVALAAGAVVLVAVISGAAVLAARAGGGDPPPIGMHPVVVGAADAGASAAPVAAGATTALTADALDAGHASAEADAGVIEAESAVRHRKVKSGRLVVETRPWSEVRLNGKLLGITPLSVTVPVGEHALRLSNAEQKLSRTVNVAVTEDKPAVVRVDLRAATQ